MVNVAQILKDGKVQSLIALDETICHDLLEVPVDPSTYHPAFWFGVVGMVALGKSLEWISTNEDSTAEARIIAKWLMDNDYTTDAYVECKGMTDAS